MKEITTYHEKKYVDDTLKLRELLTQLPPFAKEYFRAMEPTSSVRTRIAYAYDLRVFFTYLIDTNPVYRSYQMTDFRPTDLDQLQSVDLEEYMEYLKVYDSPTKQMTNTERGIYRKMSSLRSFYAYYYKRQLITTNPTLLVDMPKIHEKNIIRLEPDEIANLLDYIEKGGENLTGQRKAYYEKTKIRDFAIVTLLLGTGIRVSELVGLDLEDVDFKNNGLHLIRKGNKEMIVYFGEEVEYALQQYINTDRKKIIPLSGHEHALFFSMQKKRIGVQAVQNLVKKYAKEITPLKKITPHKLRSTYGTSLYQETDDIPVTAVASVIQHNTSGIISRAGEGMDRPKGMAGHSYATWNGAIELATIEKVVEADGGDYSKVELIPSTVTDEVSALKTNSVDSIWIFYAWAGVKTELEGLETDYFAFADIDPVFDYYTPVIISGNKFLEENPETAKAFLSALSKGYEFAIENPEEAAEILCDAAPELDKELVVASQKYLADQYRADAPYWGFIDADRWNNFYKWVNDNKLVEGNVMLNSGFTNEYLPQ